MDIDYMWLNTDRTLDVAHAFNDGIDQIKDLTGEKAKLQSMPESQSEVIDNLGSAYDSTRGMIAGIPLAQHVPNRESSNYLRQGEVSARFEYLKSFDTLTGFLNERGVRDELLQRVARANRSEHGGFGIIIMDIKNFKYLNDALGHNNGDLILQDVAKTLRTNCRVEDSLWRIAGDEFAVIMDFDNIQKLEELIFQQRHGSKGGQNLPSWLESCNETLRSNLKSLVVKTELSGSDLGDAGELRAGIFYLDKEAIKQLGGDGDVIGSLIKASKAQLEVVKEEQKSQSMIYKKETS